MQCVEYSSSPRVASRVGCAPAAVRIPKEANSAASVDFRSLSAPERFAIIFILFLGMGALRTAALSRPSKLDTRPELDDPIVWDVKELGGVGRIALEPTKHFTEQRVQASL